MTAQPTPQPADANSETKPEADKAKAKPKKQQDGLREISESFVVAFVLAFLFRAFEAEAFVIPTGSMAPTLFGRHKECTCQQCGYLFMFGASDEVEDDSGTFEPGRRIHSAICPNCRFENSVFDLPAFKGDRIIVNKFPYEFGEPERWDVPVFKYPEKPTTNYIKRLVGLPNETIVIKRGDVYRQEEDRSMTVLRKEPNKQKTLQIPVYDNNYPETALHQKGWPRRWAAVTKSTTPDAPQKEAGLGPVAGWTESAQSWDEESNSHSFVLSADKAKAGTLHWLRYRHIVPAVEDWAAISDQPKNPAVFFSPAPGSPRPELISDFCGYNSYSGGNGDVSNGRYWVSDLTLSSTVDVLSAAAGSEILFELNEGVRCFRVRVDLATGKAKLISVVRLNPQADEEDLLAEADSPLKGVDDFRVRFANVDNRLCFWVNEKLIDFGAKAEYREDEATQPGPQDEDLIPVGIAVKGASVRVSNLLIERDIYYRASQLHGADANHFSIADMDEHPDEFSLRRALKNPAEWTALYFPKAREAKFPLKADEFLMLGDNSPRSQDSRVWPNVRGAEHRHAVPRSALVGRAFFVYWPHGVPFMNDGQGFAVWHLKSRNGDEKYADLRVPFYPNISRMRRIR